MVEHLAARGGQVGDIDRLCGEIVSELQEIIGMTTTYRDTIGAAGRYLAHVMIQHQTSASADPEGHAFAVALGRIAGVEDEIRRLLPRGGAS